MIKALETILFNLATASSTILSFYFLFFFLIIASYFLIPAVITQIVNPAEELTIPIAISTEEAKTEVKTHSVNAEAKTRKCSI